jgi:hypothetical protein
MRGLAGLAQVVRRELDDAEREGAAREAAALKAYAAVDRLIAALGELEVEVLAGAMDRVQENVARVSVSGEILGPIERRGSV